MTQRFEPGELVRVVIDGVRYQDRDQLTSEHSILDADGNVYILPRLSVIERVAPPEWPPQPGDIWEDRNGNEWIFVDSDGETILMRGIWKIASTESEDALDVLNDVGSLRLVRRRGWTPDEPAAEPDKPELDFRAARVAGLRAFADLLESRTDVPVPYGINGQVGFAGAEGLTEALRLAASLGVELGAARDTQDKVQRWARGGKVHFGGDVTLTLYAHGLDAPEPVDCCPDAEPEATS